ncbi:MAG TPA: hypothetical protein VJ738_06360 [Steroidobacteraceae bacterium]|nr:hypothetical protein [Steroidobacteraceae bacterium]
MSSESERRARAEQRRRTVTLHLARLGGIEPDPVPVSGAEAVSLVERLTRESWTAAGRTFPQYSRAQISVSFTPRRPK